jgi:hypothetical protein
VPSSTLQADWAELDEEALSAVYFAEAVECDSMLKRSWVGIPSWDEQEANLGNIIQKKRW